MSWTQLVVVVLLAWAPAPDADALVAGLSAPREADREEAAGALEELGREALPALRRAREADDPGLRDRVARLIDLIERQRLLRATRIRLDFDDRPLAEVAEAIRSRTGFPVRFRADDPLGARRVTLRQDEPATFWEVLDRLQTSCAVGHRPDYEYTPTSRGLTIRLGPAEEPRVPTSDAGPFRVYLVRLSRHREVVPAQESAAAGARESVSAELHVLAEPGLAVNPVGAVVLEQAADDRGRDLRPDDAVQPAWNRSHPPRFEEGSEGLFPLEITLKTLPGPAGRLKRLKGYVPVSVIARTGGPIVLPLKGAAGQPVSGGGITLRAGEITRNGESASFTLSMSGEPVAGPASPAAPRRPGEIRPPFRLEDHIQVQDEQGKALWWNPGPSREVNGAVETTVTVYPRNDAKPARLLYHGVVGAVTELAFEFGDVAMP